MTGPKGRRPHGTAARRGDGARSGGTARANQRKTRSSARDADRASKHVQLYARQVWRAIDTPESRWLEILSYFGEDGWRAIARRDINPADYSSAFDFYLDYQAVKLVSKNEHLPTGLNTQTVAFRKFIEAEQICLDTNARIREVTASGAMSPTLSRVIATAQAKIAAILGDVPTLEQMDFHFGPGAAFGVRGDTTSYHKVTSTLQCTQNMVATLPEFLGEFPGWFDGDFVDVELVPGSDLTTVRKDAKTDRVICIEPLLNGLKQTGYGSWIRNRLMLHGISLNDQTVNQRLAGLAKELGLATVDFSSASDMIAYLLVWFLLPVDWADALDTARCPSYRAEGRWYRFQKFSSMGNGYTFELESLIFYALAYACTIECGIQPRTGENVSVYGDDVIIPSNVFGLFNEVCSWCGFRVNASKTFASGDFYESCGTDYYNGSLVTPFRLKVGLTNPWELIYGANSVCRIAERAFEVATLDEHKAKAHAIASALSGCHRDIVQGLAHRYMVLGPWSDENRWLSAPFDRGTPTRGVFGYRHRALKQRPRLYKPEGDCWPTAYVLYNARSIHRSRTSMPGSLTTLAKNFVEWPSAVLHSRGAALREDEPRYDIGNTQSHDWNFPLSLAGYFWQGY